MVSPESHRPSTAERYDLIVVGAGAAGLSAARFATRLGARVALIDRERPGGDCLAAGCVPSKTLLKAAKVAWQLRHADQFGLHPTIPTVDLGRINAHVQATIEQVYQSERPEALREEGIAFFAGGARFVGPDNILVGDHRLQGGRVLICTGAHAIRPGILGLDRIRYLTYDDVFHLPTLPDRLLVLGTGPVGVELAQAFGRLGSRVTVIGRSGRLLSKADPSVQAAVEEILFGEGVDLRLHAGVERVDVTPRGEVQVITKEGSVAGDALLVAVGRAPNVAGLDLGRAGIVADDRGIVVDEHLRTSNPRVYACGDVIGRPQLSHYAAWQAFLAVRNALLPGASRGVRADVPWAVFTDPEIAAVGLTETAARARHGKGIRVYELGLDRLDRAQTDGDTRGLVKVVLRRDGQILGAHVVAARAGEMIQEYVLAMNHQIRFDQLASSIHVYPTYATANQQLAARVWISRLLGGLKGRVIRTVLRRARSPSE